MRAGFEYGNDYRNLIKRLDELERDNKILKALVSPEKWKLGEEKVKKQHQKEHEQLMKSWGL